MKYGLLYYKDTDNVGDDIQAYAASRFLPKIDYMIDRENLESFVPRKKEYVATIMNAWYIHDKFNFNISPYIYPCFISMFFKKFPYEKGVTLGTDYINDNVINMLKKHGPVGTRDLHTKKIMDDLGVDNYFSGCMTLTINKFKDIKKSDYIVTVGLTKEEIDYIKSKTNRPIKVFKQDVKKGSFAEETWEQRKQRVENTLKLYQGAHMVITNKLHCSLPCLALETPVLLLYDNSFSENKDRIGTYLRCLNYIDRKKLKNSTIDFENPKSNPKEYLELRKLLIKKVNYFIDNLDHEKPNVLPEVDFYEKYVLESKNSRRPIIKHLNKLSSKYEKECEKSSKMYEELEELGKKLAAEKLKYEELEKKLLTEYEELEKKLLTEYEELEKKYKQIINSKVWKLSERIRKLWR